MPAIRFDIAVHGDNVRINFPDYVNFWQHWVRIANFETLYSPQANYATNHNALYRLSNIPMQAASVTNLSILLATEVGGT